MGEAAGFGARGGEAGVGGDGRQRQAGLQLGAGDLHRRQIAGEAALLEGGARGRGGGLGGLRSVQQGGGLAGQQLLGLVDLGALQRAQPLDLVQRQFGEQLQEAHHVGVLGVAPELPVIVGAAQVGVEPDRPVDGLAHLHPRGGGHQRRGQAERLRPVHPPDQVDAVDDIAPLLGAAELQGAAVAPVQLDEVGCLHQHVVELEESQRLLGLQPAADELQGDHLVDGEVHAVLAQEVDVAQPVQPLGVVAHHRVGGVATEAQERLEGPADAGDVGGDHRVGEHGTLGGLVGRVADLGGAAAHQHDRPVAGLLQPAQGHDLHQAADVQRGRGGVEADVGGDRAFQRGGVQAGDVARLVDVAALDEHADEVRLGLERREIGLRRHERLLGVAFGRRPSLGKSPTPT